LWAPGLESESFQSVHQTQFGTGDIAFACVGVTRGAMACAVQVRVLSWKISGQKSGYSMSGPRKGWLAATLLMVAISTLALALGIWLVKRRSATTLFNP
jgi:hypothetical protein